jgi:magnesium chelatase subunit D
VVRAQAGPVRDAWLATLRSLMPAGMPLVRLPLHAGEDRLLGGIDLPATLAAGRPGGATRAAGRRRWWPGAGGHGRAHGRQHRVAPGGGAGQRRRGRLERDGISALTPTRLAVVALDEALPTMTPLSPALADRLGLWVDLRRCRCATSAEADMAWPTCWPRAVVPQVQVPEALIEALCAAALALGVGSARAAWLAVRVARASAALCDRPLADADDAALAARLVLAPRATRLPSRRAGRGDARAAAAGA